ncbi:MAG: hypothetical protein JNG85_12780, partial [Spirochaetaceae bacterium]|nr:hypothetical protein [Spirochaetaceae bacterium]
YASGIEVTRGALELAAGLSPSGPGRDRGWVSAERAFISIPGRVERLHGLREAEAAPYAKNLFLRVGPGERCVFPSNNVEKCGNVITQAPDRESAVAAAEAAIRGILVRLSPADEATEAFLRGEGRIANPDGTTWPPEAFFLPVDLAAALADLPERLEPAGPDAGGRSGGAPASAGRSRGVRVAPLAPELASGLAAATGRDWAGRSFPESAELALRLAGASWAAESAGAVPAPSATSAPGAAGPVLAGRFWRALARGGAQAALYVLDTEARGREGA